MIFKILKGSNFSIAPSETGGSRFLFEKVIPTLKGSNFSNLKIYFLSFPYPF